MIKHFRLPRYSEMAGLLGVPIEIIFMICGYLDINQLFNFGATCQHLHYILKSESICRVALQVTTFLLDLLTPSADDRVASKVLS